MSTITEIRDRLEAKAGDVAGTRPYWDCIDSLLDVAEAAQKVVNAGGGAPSKLRPLFNAVDDLKAALGKLPQKSEDDDA